MDADGPERGYRRFLQVASALASPGMVTGR
jgi:hypothetical protein